MNGSMNIFSLETLGQPASLSERPLTDGGNDAFAETLAASLAASVSTAIVPVRSVERGPDASLGFGGASVADKPMTGAIDLHQRAIPSLESPAVATGLSPSQLAMTVEGAQQTPKAASSGSIAPLPIPAATTEAESLDLADRLRSSAAILTSHKHGLAERQTLASASTEAASRAVSGGQNGDVPPDKTPVRGGDRRFDGAHILDQEPASATSTTSDALSVVAGPVDLEHFSSVERTSQPAEHFSRPDARNHRVAGDAASPARIMEALSKTELPAASVAATPPSDGVLAAKAPLTGTTFEETATRPRPQATVAAPTRSSIEAPVDPVDDNLRRGTDSLQVNRIVHEPVKRLQPTAERKAEAIDRVRPVVGMGANLADTTEPASSNDPRLGNGGAHGLSVISQGADSQATRTPTPSSAGIQPLAADTGVRPNSEISGFERLQPGFSMDHAAADVERFEPVTAATSSRSPASGGNPAPAAQIALQIARALPGGIDRLSVHLKPAELGSVDIQLIFEGQGRMSALITAERPETLELLQRDGRLLERSLGDSGLKLADDGLSFALKQDQQQQQGQGFHEQAQARKAAFQMGRGYDDVSDSEQPPTLHVDGLRLLDIHT